MILVTSPKGGVGVTTVVAEIARHFASQGREVVAVNLTDQAALGFRVADGDSINTLDGIVYRSVDEAISRGKGRADFALAQRRADAVVIVDVSAGDRETTDLLLSAADVVLCVLTADAGSIAVLPQAVQLKGATSYYLLNLVDERRALAVDAVTLFGATFGDRFLGIIRHDETVNEALALLGEVPPGSAASNDFASLALRLDRLIAEGGAPNIRDTA